MLLIIIVLLLGCFGVILNSKKIPIKNNLLAILLLVSLLFIHNYYNNLEQFQQADEATMLGIAGKSTINNLQSDQDNEVEAKRQKTGNKEDESRLVELDQMAVTALRNENTKKSCPSVLTDTHLGWFRHPPKRPRSHQ